MSNREGYLAFNRATGGTGNIETLSASTPTPGPILETPPNEISNFLDAKAAEQLTNPDKPIETDLEDGGALIYPQNLFQPGCEAYIFFIMRDSNLRSTEVKKRIGLYMPPSIKVRYHTTWEEINLTLKQNFNFLKEVNNTFNPMAQGLPSNPGAVQNMKNLGTAGAMGGAKALDAIKGGNFGQQSQVYFRKTVDPSQALLFKGVDFRTFQFEFQLMARTPQESESIRKIIKIFKYGMHPGSSGGFFWEYPYNFDIYLLTPSHKYMFNISQSVLETMDVDYGGSGAASFFRGTGAPVDIRLTLQFKELEVLTKQRIMQDY